MEISHGFLKNYTGSASVSMGCKNTTVLVSGPTECMARDDLVDKMTIDLKYRIFPSQKSYENMINGLLLKILDRFLLREYEKNRSISISIISNTNDVAITINCLLVALLDSGIPLSDMFYAVGKDDLAFVYSKDSLILSHSPREIQNLEIEQYKEKLEYMKEQIHFAFRDVFLIN